MRKKWLGLITIVALVMIVAACSSDKSASTPAPTQTTGETTASTPKEGGSLTIAVASDPLVLNPLYAGDRVTLTIDQALYSPLFLESEGKKRFYLADSLDISKDFLTYTIKLKSGLKWHDGQPLTADDVIFTFEKILDESQHSPDRANYLINDKPIQASKVDDTTVQFKLPEVSPAFESTLQSVVPIPKHIFEKEADIEKSTANAKPVGSGPFKFKEYKTGEYVALERFDDYFGGKPHLDNVIYRIAKDANTANLALQNGELNVKYLDPQDVETIKATGKFDIFPYSEGRLGYLMFNQNSEVGVLKKKEVRQALSYALNREELINLSYLSSEYADPAKSILAPNVLYYTNDVVSNDYNPEKAKQLLKDAGVSGLKLRFIIQGGNKLQESQALYIQQKFKDIGVEVELQNLDSSAWVAKFVDKKATDVELALSGYIMGVDPSSYQVLFDTNGSSNYTHYSNEKVDALFKQGATEVDGTKREEIYKEIQQTIAEDAPIYPIAYNKAIVAVDSRYGGVEEAILKPIYIFEDLSKLYLK